MVTSKAILNVSQQARLDGLRAALIPLGAIALLALFSGAAHPQGATGLGVRVAFGQSAHVAAGDDAANAAPAIDLSPIPEPIGLHRCVGCAAVERLEGRT